MGGGLGSYVNGGRYTSNIPNLYQIHVPVLQATNSLPYGQREGIKGSDD